MWFIPSEPTLSPSGVDRPVRENCVEINNLSNLSSNSWDRLVREKAVWKSLNAERMRVRVGIASGETGPSTELARVSVYKKDIGRC